MEHVAGGVLERLSSSMITSLIKYRPLLITHHKHFKFLSSYFVFKLERITKINSNLILSLTIYFMQETEIENSSSYITGHSMPIHFLQCQKPWTFLLTNYEDSHFLGYF